MLLNVHQRISTVDEAVTNQGTGRVTQHVPASFSPLAQMASEQSSHGGSHGGYAGVQQHRFLLLKADQPIAAAAYPATTNEEKCQVLLQYNRLREPTSYLVAK